MFASYPACCQDYAICHLDSQPDQDLDQQRHIAGSSVKICTPWFAFSRVKGRTAAELEEARVECAGCLCTLGCKSGCSTTRKRVSNPGTTQDTCTLRHCKYEKLGMKLCVVGEPGCRPRAEVRTYTKCQSSRPPELVLFPNPFTCVRKRVSCSEQWRSQARAW